MTMPSIADRVVDELELPEGIEVPPPPCVFGAGAKGDPRLIITHIVNYNFKSYAGKQVLGPFHKCFTGIVGPNGSGKSNVIDSMLFVFGYRANKIRSKKLSVLIHNSENHKSASSCTVEVHFEKIVDLDNGGYCTVPNSAFYVSRTASADSSSQYYIDGKKRQFKDVAALLQTNGIDLNHNRFLILQGEVEQIALMKPKAVNEHGDGMLEYLEDIIGSSRFKEAIEKLGKDIEDLDEERKDRLSRVKVVEKDREQLEPLRNEALEFLRKQNARTVLQNQLLQAYINTFQKDTEQQRQKMEEMSKDVEQVETELKKSKASKKERVRDCAKLAKRLEEASAKHTEKKDEMRELEKRNVKVFEDRKHRKTKLKELNKKLDKETKKLADLKLQPEKIDQEVNELTEERAELSKRKKETERAMNAVMETLRDDTKHLQKEKEELETVLLEKMKYVNEAKGQFEIADQRLQLFVSNLKKAEHALEQCKKKLTDVSYAEKGVVDELNSLRESLPVIDKKTVSARAALKELKAREAKLESLVREGRASLAEIKHSASSNRSKGAVSKFLMQMKNSGKIPGIYGRLGDLGGIDEKYDVAISSCCPALENMVVDNIETAQKCVQALKQNQVGQATFIALDKMARHQQAAAKSGNYPLTRLIDLVKLKEEKFRVAFYHALRDTLVADEIQQASKVAYNKNRRWRVVTLKGEVIDTSGTMSGGGNRVVRGRMGSSCVSEDISPDEIDKLQKKNDKLTAELQTVQGDISAYEEDLSTLEEESRKNRSRVQLLSRELTNNQSMQSSLRSQLPDLEKDLREAQPDSSRLSTLEKEAESLKRKYEAVAEDAKKVEKKKDAIHEKICQVNEKKLKPLREKLSAQSEQIDAASKKITKLKVSANTVKRNLDKCEKTIENLQNDVKENSESIEELEKEWKQLEVDGLAVVNDLEKCEEEEKRLSAEMNEIQSDVKKLEGEENAVAEKLKNLKQNFDRVNADCLAKLDKKKDYEEKLSKLKLREIDGETGEVLRTHTPEELEGCEEDLQTRITVLDSDVAAMKPNMAAIDEYNAKHEVYLQRVAELDKVTEKRDKYRGMHDQLRRNRLNEFSQGFSIITNKLKEIYQMITLGGDAELEFVDSLDPFAEGIVFSVRPPKKSWKNICNLSGGEKTLSSLALVFALHHYRPTPLYVMDEIDAALDFKNVTIIARYIIERTKNAQFIIISLRNNMFEVANRLVGIYKTDNCTKSATIEPALIDKVMVGQSEKEVKS